MAPEYQWPQQKAIAETAVGRYPLDERRRKIRARIAEVERRIGISEEECQLANGDDQADVHNWPYLKPLNVSGAACLVFDGARYDRHFSRRITPMEACRLWADTFVRFRISS